MKKHKKACLVYLFLLTLLCPALNAQDNATAKSWMMDGLVGVYFDPVTTEWTPLIELGWFHDAIPVQAPEFFDLGGRISLTPSWVSLAAGARHKMYFSQTPDLFQEVLLSSRLAWDGTFLLGLQGAFGGDLILQGVSSPHPDFGVEVSLIWSLMFKTTDGALDSKIGVAVGLLGSP